MTRKRYRRPPVVEALCEVSFAGSQWDDAVAGRFYDAVRGEFPKRQQITVLETEMKVAASGEISAAVRPKRPLGAVMPVVLNAQDEAERVFEATITDRLRERFQS